jgi:cell wall-associated NlpC family hydrolase
MASLPTTVPANLSTFDPPTARLGSSSLRRLGTGLLTGAAASLAITLAPGTAAAAEPAPASSSSATPAPSQAAQIAVDTARAQVGKAYEYGAAGPDSFDCSGLAQYAYAAAGISLPDRLIPAARCARPAQRWAGRSGGTFRTPKTSRRATRAALSPHWPCTAGPGGVAADAR